jgi:hypothetical protein
MVAILVALCGLATSTTLTNAQNEKTIQIGKMHVYTIDDPVEGKDTVIYTDDLIPKKKSWYTFYISFHCRNDRLNATIISDLLNFGNEEDRYFLYRFQNGIASERRLWFASTNAKGAIAPSDVSRPFFKEARKRKKGIIRHKSPAGNIDFIVDFTGIDQAAKFLSCV